MSEKKVLSELRGIERELHETELLEHLSMVESRQSFHLGLVLGLVFAVVAGFFAIIAHEIFIADMSFRAKLAITVISAAVLLFCLYIGLREDRKNKETRKKTFEYLAAAKKRRSGNS